MNSFQGKSQDEEKFIFEFSKMNEWLPLLDAFVCTKIVPKDPKVLEIGVYRGGWLISLAENLPEMTAVGIDPYPENELIRQAFLEDLVKRGLSPRIFLYSSWENLLVDSQNHFRFDLIHIDGVHDESNVKADLVQAAELISEDGVIVVDDIFYHSYPGVTSATFQFILERDFSPFLFTQKKLYLCKSAKYASFYELTTKLFEDSHIPFEIDQNLSKNHSGYFQSNSIYGNSLIITDSDLSINKKFLRHYQLSGKPFSMKEFIRQILPPVLLESIKRLL
jgi:hypothetical protein